MNRELSRDALLRALLSCAEGEENEATLIALTIRRVLAARGSVLRRALVAEVEELLSPALGDGCDDEIDEMVDSLRDLGDLVLSSRGPHFPLTAELASGALVKLPGGSAIVLGRIELALPSFARASITLRGLVRTLPTGVVGEELFDEVSFHGCRVLEVEGWSEAPEEQSAALFLGRAIEGASRYAGDGSAFEVFDPAQGSWFYRDRFRGGALMDVLTRDGWAAAREQRKYGPRAYALFGRVAGEFRRATLERASFVRVCGACASAAHGGRRHLVRREGDIFRLHFPPPPWLGRLLCTALPVERHGALYAVRATSELAEYVAEALQTLLFCEMQRYEEAIADVRPER